MYVCICNNVTEREIHQALEQGAASMRELHQSLQVGACCGKCVCVARDIIRSHKTSEAQLDLAQAVV